VPSRNGWRSALPPLSRGNTTRFFDVFNLDVPKHQLPHKDEKPQPHITFFPARLKDGVVNVPDWSEMKNQLGGVP